MALVAAPTGRSENNQFFLPITKALHPCSVSYANIRITDVIRRNYLSASFAGRPHKNCLHSKKMRINTHPSDIIKPSNISKLVV